MITDQTNEDIIVQKLDVKRASQQGKLGHSNWSKCFIDIFYSGHLARHHRIHTGEKNFHCLYPGCPSRFSRQDNMMQHYRTHMSSRSRHHYYHYQQQLQYHQQQRHHLQCQYTYYGSDNTNTPLYSLRDHNSYNVQRREWSSFSSTSTNSSMSSRSSMAKTPPESNYYYHSQSPMPLHPPMTPMPSLHPSTIPPMKNWINQVHPTFNSNHGSYYHHYEEYVWSKPIATMYAKRTAFNMIWNFLSFFLLLTLSLYALLPLDLHMSFFFNNA